MTKTSLCTAAYTVEINASPEKVFDLISKVEEFSKYSGLITGIERVGEDTYRWNVSVLGIPLSWDSLVTEAIRPVSFKWHSVSGLYNEGSYKLKPYRNGTTVKFTMHYRLSGISLLDEITAPIHRSLIESVYKEFLGNVKKALEG